jgi:hypothetical protein
MSSKKLEPQFVVCIKNDGYKASLELRKIYQILPDAVATSHWMLRVTDESGEDYLYPADLFTPITLPQALAKVFTLTASANSASA